MKSIKIFLFGLFLSTLMTSFSFLISSYVAPPRYKPTLCIWGFENNNPNGSPIWTVGCETLDPLGPCGTEVCCPRPPQQ